VSGARRLGAKRLVLLPALIAASCLGPAEADLDNAGEAVVRHFIGEALTNYPDGLFRAACLGREAGPEQQDEAAFLARFQDAPLPVVSAERCGESQEGHWRVEESGERAFRVTLGRLLRGDDDELVLEASTSNSSMDYAAYECTLVRGPDGWRVRECRVTILT
jgi:hypothetical protein